MDNRIGLLDWENKGLKDRLNDKGRENEDLRSQLDRIGLEL